MDERVAAVKEHCGGRLLPMNLLKALYSTSKDTLDCMTDNMRVGKLSSQRGACPPATGKSSPPRWEWGWAALHEASRRATL
jgi:hypothetical protein